MWQWAMVAPRSYHTTTQVQQYYYVAPGAPSRALQLHGRVAPGATTHQQNIILIGGTSGHQQLPKYQCVGWLQVAPNTPNNIVKRWLQIPPEIPRRSYPGSYYIVTPEVLPDTTKRVVLGDTKLARISLVLSLFSVFKLSSHLSSWKASTR